MDPHEKAQSDWKEFGGRGAPSWDPNPHKLFRPDLPFTHPQMMFNDYYRDWGSLRNSYPDAWTPSQKMEIEGWTGKERVLGTTTYTTDTLQTGASPELYPGCRSLAHKIKAKKIKAKNEAIWPEVELRGNGSRLCGLLHPFIHKGRQVMAPMDGS